MSFARAVSQFVFFGLGVICAHGANPAPGEWAPNLTLSSTWHDNATNAVDAEDQLDSLQLTGDLLSWRDYAIGRQDTLRLNAHLGAEAWPRYRKLLTGAAGGRVEWLHTIGRDPLAPVLSAELGMDAVLAAERGRTGTAAFVTLAFRKRLNASWRAAVLYTMARHDSSRAVYDSAHAESELQLGHDFSPSSRFTIAARFRDGDVLTYAAAPSAEVQSVTRTSAAVNTFNRPQTVSRLDARTWGGRMAYMRAFDDATALVLAYEVRNTRAQPVRFTNQLITVAIVHQF